MQTTWTFFINKTEGNVCSTTNTHKSPVREQSQRAKHNYFTILKETPTQFQIVFRTHFRKFDICSLEQQKSTTTTKRVAGKCWRFLPVTESPSTCVIAPGSNSGEGTNTNPSTQVAHGCVKSRTSAAQRAQGSRQGKQLLLP